MAGKSKYNFNKEDLEKMYKETKSMKKMAEILGINEKTVKTYLTKFGIDTSFSIGNRRHEFNEDYFEVIDTEEKAYWLGFIMADGCVYRGADKYSYRLQINLMGKDIEHLKRFNKAIGADYKIVVKKSISSYSIRSHEPLATSTIKVNSTKMCKDLINIGVMPHKTFREKFPFLNDDLYKHYIRGYFDGDGCISLNTSKGIYAFEIIGGLQSMVNIREYLPVRVSLYKIDNGKYSQPLYKIVTASKENLLKLRSWLYEDASIFLVRKKKIFDDIEQCPPYE
jgi:hypothetical protein